MPSLEELMGQDIYDLIYTHYDEKGDKIDDFEEVLLCEDFDIDKSKIEPLKKLLVPVSNPKETLVPIEAAKLLAAWGVDEAIDYFQYCIETRIDKLGNLEPHRLHGYDTTYEEITDSLLKYYARCYDRREADIALKKISPLLSKILLLAKEIPYNLSYIISTIKRENWRLLESELKECFLWFIKQKDKQNNYWNLIDLKLLFQKWDCDFVKNLESQYGIIDIPN